MLVCEINDGPIDKVYRNSCRSIGIQKAVDQLVYRISYKVGGFITFGLHFLGFTEKLQIPSNKFGLTSIFNFELAISSNSVQSQKVAFCFGL